MSTTITPSSDAYTHLPPSNSPTVAQKGLAALPLRRQRLLGVAILWLILAVMIAVNAFQSRALLYTEREQRMVTAVDIALSTLEHYHQLAEQGQLSLPEAQRQAFNTLRDVRFGEEDNYLFAFNGSLRMLAHPNREVGEDISQVKDPEGTLIFQTILENTQETGSGFTEYFSNFARGDDAQPQVRAYSAAFTPWALRRWVWNSPPELGQNMTSTAAGGMTWTAPRF